MEKEFANLCYKALKLSGTVLAIIPARKDFELFQKILAER